MIDHPAIGKLEYTRITPYIYIGTNMCCETHFDKGLLKKRLVADISLEKERLDMPFGVQFFLWLPVKNHIAPTQDQLRIGTQILGELVRMKKKVYVHCQNGHERAPTLVAAYLITQGMGIQEAIRFIKSKRKTIHPNSVQKGALRKFQESLS